MTPLPSKAVSQRGFTLVELLVVIAIVAVLASLAIPAALAVRARAQNVHCLDNIRQLGLALGTFVAEHHKYPLWVNPGWRKGQNDAHRTYWSAAIFPSVGTDSFFEKGVWDCPTASKPDGWQENEVYVDYGYNAYGMGTFVPGDDLGLGSAASASGKDAVRQPIKEGQVTTPSDTYALGDSFTGWPTVIAAFATIFMVPGAQPSSSTVPTSPTAGSSAMTPQGRVVATFTMNWLSAVPFWTSR